MRVHKLELKNIGPFKEGVLNFVTKNDNENKPPVTIITGENGTGKTVILDAIRAMLFGQYGRLERNIVREQDFEISLSFNDNNSEIQQITTLEKFENNLSIFYTNNHKFNYQYIEYKTENSIETYDNNSSIDTFKIKATIPNQPNWITNYWTSKQSSNNFELKNIVSPAINNYLFNSLNGVQRSLELIELITYFDYLKDSASPKEKETGVFFYQTITKIIKQCLDKGEFAYVKRTKLEPVILQNKKEISLDKLSSGNLYLIQRMISLLGQMYAVHQIHDVPINKICETQGLLLIDEAENHLHPKWQKTFINNILEIFPNLQIILTTHSPFIVSSIKNSRIYVCTSKDDCAVITDETSEYSNKPIDGILISPLFGATQVFSTEITKLLLERKKAIEKNNEKLRDEIENVLKIINPTYFAYFDTDKLFDKLIGSK